MAQRIAAIDSCPITQPNGDLPPDPSWANSKTAFGNGILWVALWPYSNVYVDVPRADGSISLKTGWWRGVAGKLQIDGHRLDAGAPPLMADVSDGYGDTGFQPSTIVFPTEGCWEITGRVDNASLTFVTLVIAA